MVTGGAGFIGSYLTDTLLEKGNEVIVYDNFDDYYAGKKKNLKNATRSRRFKLIEADILDYKRLAASMGDIDIVFHLAAQPGVRFSANNPWKTNKVNVEGTLNVMLSAKENDVCKVVFASSSSVYGDAKYLPWDEKHSTSPISVYGVSKLAAEKYCQTFHQSYQLPIVMLRYHTVYGPRQRPDMAVRIFTEALSRDRSPIIYGNGKQTRDFTYISDVIEGTIHAAECEESVGEIFNIGSGTRVTVEKVIEIIKKALDKHNVSQVYQEPKSGDVQDTYASIEKAKRILGYEPKISIQKGLENFVSWFKQNDN